NRRRCWHRAAKDLPNPRMASRKPPERSPSGAELRREFPNVTKRQSAPRWCLLTKRRRLQPPDRVVLCVKDWAIAAICEQLRLNQHQRQQLNRRVRDNYLHATLGDGVVDRIGPVVRGVSYEGEEIGRA